MASHVLPSNAADTSTSEVLTVNLQIKSPSAGVSRPLLFPNLPAATTITQLKEKIRDALPIRPDDQHQRLISRGRAIVTDSESLLDVLGADHIRSTDQHTIHLVIKQSIDSVPTTGRLNPTPTSNPTPQNPNHAAQNPPHNGGPRPPSGLPLPGYGFPMRGPTDSASPHPPSTPTNGMRPEHQSMSDWLRDVASRSHQQARAIQEARGRLPGMGTPTITSEANAARASSAPGHTIYRETIGPHGRTYQMSTVQTFVHSAGNRQREEQDLLEEARRAVGGQQSGSRAASRDDLHRSASNTSLYNRQFPRPGVTTPIGSSEHPRGPTPEHAIRPSGSFENMNASGPRSAPPPQSQQHPVEVYILSSPEGPRALLVNNTTSETYYTPQIRSATSFPQLRRTAIPMSLVAENHNTQYASEQLSTTQATNNHAQQQQPAQPPPPAPLAQQRQEQEANVQQPAANELPQDRAQAALPPALLQIWPHVWAMLRAGFFFWAFTSSDSIWIRWGTIVGCTLLSLLMSTGTLGLFAHRAWQPIGRQLEHLLPRMEQPLRPGRQQANGHRGPDAGNQPDANPAGMAARLVADRQGRETWLPRQLRRVERASLLFLASIAPGVAERHIANLEAEARAERERQAREQQEAEATAQAAATAAAQEGEKSRQDTQENQDRANAISDGDTSRGQGVGGGAAQTETSNS